MMAHAWLVFWLGLTGASAGAIAWSAIHRLTGGAWGDVLAPRWRMLRALLPLAAMVGLPLLIGAAHVFPWMHGHVDDARRWYLNYPFLAGRAVGCFVAWGLAWAMLARAPAGSLILWFVACTVFANDWIVSLSPDWRSAAMGLVVALGQLVLAMATAVAATPRDETDATTRRDIGALLFALCLGWAYLAGVDYLTAWSADLPYEARWYLPRTRDTWGAVVIAAAVFHLAVPFVLLLARRAKEQAGILRAAALSMLVGQLGHLAWLVMP
ncbi:hypothetical protein [Luteibacter sp. 329MFSha]|uniref:hypothetical protein n=1 Tax=Luteibacter sp. 329MFSha TaxID=1798239 RepID=UPI0008CFB03E|nr:hypothetical protein [Luteibacter sp. 329MFSha]SEV84975.1 hypothetical protein SAMN04515660_0254 [Luteibacter sp. 329MFSha]